MSTRYRKGTLRHVTYNLLDYGRSRDEGNRLRWVRETIEATDGDVYSIQEIYGTSKPARLAVFTDPASSLGLEYNAVPLGDLIPTEPVFDPGHGVRGVGVMWRPGRIKSVPGSLRTYDRAGLHVGIALVRLRVEDRVEITLASTHWPPDEIRTLS